MKNFKAKLKINFGHIRQGEDCPSEKSNFEFLIAILLF